MDATVAEKSAKRGCARNCRSLLEQQVAAATNEVDAARAEMRSLQAAKQAELTAAKQALEALPKPPSTTALAELLDIDAWKLDLSDPLLASIALNLGAAFFIALAAHGFGHAPEPRDVERKSKQRLEPVTEPQKQVIVRNAEAEAHRFAQEMLEPSKNGRIKVFQVLVRYDEWADAQGLDPLNERIIAGELNTLFLREGIYYEGEGQDMVACGVQWKLKVIEDKRGQQAA